MVQRTGHHTEDAPKKLYRSGENKIIAGICGGIGDYLNLIKPLCNNAGFKPFKISLRGY